MQAIVSFHPVDPAFFDSLIAPLFAGTRPEGLGAHLDEAVRAYRRSWESGRWVRSLRTILGVALPPEPEPILGRDRSPTALLRASVGLLRAPRATLMEVKTRLDRFDHRLDALSKVVLQKIEPDLHLYGRPYLVTEASPVAVADAVDWYRRAPDARAVANLAIEQLSALDPELARVEPEDSGPVTADLVYRSEVFREIQAATSGAGTSRSELAWLAVRAHARVAPFWIACDVEGLDTICLRSGVPPPRCLRDAAPLFRECEAAAIAARAGAELEGPRSLGAYVPPGEIPDLLDFLTTRGGRIIQAASRHGEGPTASLVLKKIRECAVYAQKRCAGYLEASGILPPGCSEADFRDSGDPD